MFLPLKKYEKLLIVSATWAWSALTLTTLVSAQMTQPWSGVCVTSDGVATIQGLQCLIGNLLMIAMTGLGFIGFVMMIVGSFRYLLSGGNSKDTETGRKTFTYAVVGLVVALASFMAVQLVAAFTGVQSITTFQIPSSDTDWAQVLNLK